MQIKKIEGPLSMGFYKLLCDGEAVFYVRPEYLGTLALDDLFEGAVLEGERLERLLDAGLAAAAELKAIDYLARAEQCRAGLSRKLYEKGCTRPAVDSALSFLEESGYLSDGRFARSWLNGRRINHYEGRSRLFAELQSRGISRDVANSCLDEFFAENDETEICRKAVAKLKKRGRAEEKLTASLLSLGFPYRMIREVLEEPEETFL